MTDRHVINHKQTGRGTRRKSSMMLIKYLIMNMNMNIMLALCNAKNHYSSVFTYLCMMAVK